MQLSCSPGPRGRVCDSAVISPSYHGVIFPVGCFAPTRDVCLILPASLGESPVLHLKLLSEIAGESLVKQVVGIAEQFQPNAHAGPKGGGGRAHEVLSSVSNVITCAKANVPFRFMGRTQRLERLKPNSSPCRGSTKRAVLTSTSPCRIASHRQRTWGSKPRGSQDPRRLDQV